MSESFTTSCRESFLALDIDGSGSLDSAELYPVILALSSSHPRSIDRDHCARFTSIYDRDGNGVISLDEFLNYARFVILAAYIQETDQSDNARLTADMEVGVRKTEDLIETLKQGRAQLANVIPRLPNAFKQEITSRKFAENCMDHFEELDLDNNHSLDAAELLPLIVELCGASPFSIDSEKCSRFACIFDVDKNGVIDKEEFIDFAQFLMIMAYLDTDQGKAAVSGVNTAEESKNSVEDLLELLQVGRAQVGSVMPYLPQWFKQNLTDPEFIADCMQRFDQLDRDRNNALDASELFSVIVQLTDAHPFSIDQGLCQRFTNIFDVDKNGVITREEFVEYAQFMLIMAYLETAHGQETLERSEADAELQVKVDHLARENTELRARSQGLEQIIQQMEARQQAQEERLKLVEMKTSSSLLSASA